MANTSSTIQIIFEGAVRGVRQAAAAVEAAVRSVDDRINRHQSTLDKFDKGMAKVDKTLLGLVKGFLAFGGAAASIQTVVAVTGALVSIMAELAPAALALPGIVLGIGVAFGTAKLAMLGFGDALKGDAEALAKLSPAARDAVGAIRGLEGGFTKLRQAVQEDFFAGLAFDIRETGNVLLDLGQRKLPEVASGFNAMFVEGLRAARTPFFTGALGTIIDNTGRALGRFRYLLANVLIGFVGLGSVGSKYLEPLAAQISKVGKAFQAWVENGVRTGEIDRMIERALNGFKLLGRILGDVGNAASVMFSAFNKGLTGGGGTLESIERVTSAFEELASSGNVQAALTSLGETVRVLGDVFRNVLTVAVRELGPVIVAVAPFVQELATVIGEKLVRSLEFVGPLLKSFATFLSENKEAIAPVVSVLLSLWSAFKLFRALVPIIAGIRSFVTAIGALATRIRNINPATLRAIAAALRRFLLPVAIAVGVSELAKSIDEANLAAAGGDPEKMGTLAQALHNFRLAGEAIASGNFGAIFKEIGEEWQLLIDKFQAGESPAGATAQNINKFFDDLEISLTDSFRKIGESFQRDFVDVFANLGTKIQESFQRDFIDFFANLPTKVGETFEGLKTTVATKLADVTLTIANFFRNPAGVGFDIGASVGQMVINFLNGFTTLAAQTKVKLDETVTAIRDWATVKVPGALAGLAARLLLTATQAWQGFLTSTVQKLAEIVAFVGQLPARIAAALAGLVGTLIQIALNAWNSFFGQTKTGGDRSVSETRTVPGKMGSALSALPGILVQAATAAFNGFISSCQTGISRAIAVVRTLPGLVASAVGNLGGTLVSAGQSLIQGFINGINSKIAGIRAAASAAAAAARGFFPGSPAKEGPFSGRGYILFSGQALSRDFAAGIRSQIRVAAAASDQLARAVGANLNSVVLPDLTPTVDLTAAMATINSLGGSLNPAGSAALPPTATDLTAALSATPPPVTNVTVKIGETELRQIVETVIENVNREVARVVGTGRGRG